MEYTVMENLINFKLQYVQSQPIGKNCGKNCILCRAAFKIFILTGFLLARIVPIDFCPPSTTE